MLKEKLFKLLFPSKAIVMDDMDRIIKKNIDQIWDLRQEVESLQSLRLEATEPAEPTQSQFMDYCLKTLGLPYIDFANVDENGRPPHYLSGLTDAQRKDFIGHMESIYADEKFHKIVSYVINLIGNHAIQKAPEEQMRNGKIGIIGIRTLMAEFINAHQEFTDSKKPVEGFDPLAIMPE